MKKTKPRQYIVRKYVMATSALEAIKMEKNYPVCDAWVDDQWRPEDANNNPPMGFSAKKIKKKQ